MTKPLNVDICVTCVSDKPPTLPLREELTSLGIEVVYNAHGTGAKASKHESKKLIKQFREQEQVKELKQPRFFPSSPKKIDERDKERKRQEDDLRIPRALSYENYERRLLHKDSTESSSSISSWETTSTTSGSSRSQTKKDTGKKSKGWGKIKAGFKKKRGKGEPPKTVDIPSPEEQAVKDVSRVFGRSQHATLDTTSSRETEKTTSRSGSGRKSFSLHSGLHSSSGRDVSTLTSLPDDINSGKVEVTNLPTISLDPSREDRDEVEETPHDLSKDLPSIRMELSNSTRGNSTISTAKDFQSPPDPAQLKAALEFYDLTAISDDDDVRGVAFDSTSMSQGNSTLSSKKTQNGTHGVRVFSSPETRAHLPGLQMTYMESDDGYGHIVMDLSSVDEDSLSARASSYSSLVGSHRQSPRRFDLERVDEQDDGIMQAPTEPTRNVAGNIHTNEDWTTYEGVSYNDFEDYNDFEGSHAPSTFQVSDGATGSAFDGAEDGGVSQLPSPTPISHGSEFLADPGSMATAASSDMIPQGHPNTSPPEDIDVTTSNRKSDFQDNYGDVVDAFKYDDGVPGTQTVMLSETYGAETSGRSEDRSFPGMSFSGHSRPMTEEFPRVPKVSFSQDVEERYYEKDESSEERGPRHPIVAIPEDEDPVEQFYQDTSPTSQQGSSLSQEFQQHGYSGRESITSYEDCFDIPGTAKSHDYSSSCDSDSSDFSGSFRDRVYGEGAPFSESRREPVIDRVASMREGFIAALSSGIPISADVEEIMQSSPELASTRLPERERLPLHVICDRNFPDRSSTVQGSITNGLVRDIIEHKRLIEVIASANMDACTVPDENGDLPVHILARRLMEWEAHWYQKVYENAQNETNNDGGDKAASITKLYQTMSQCIDLLLLPTATSQTLCQIPGSVGYLLPLHIAAIFTVSYTTLRSLLEMYPQAAGFRCDLIDVRTFIPSNSLPLELHDRLSTDFPKWEIQDNNRAAGYSELSWSQATMEKSYGAKDCIRRSDLMFAHNPTISPYRNDPSRLQRIEARIRYEAAKVVDQDDSELSPALRLLWIWMCTFEVTNDSEHDGDSDDRDSKYFENVGRVVESLPMRTVRMLSLVPDHDGRPVIDAATAESATAIRRRLDEIAALQVPIPVGDMTTRSRLANRSYVLNEWEDNLASNLCLQGRGYVSVLCRSLFHIKEEKFPTSFVILPYKLIKDKRGRLGLESAAAAEIAMKFSDCLLHLTCPQKIRHFLEKKSIRFLGQSLGTEDDDDWFEAEDDIKDQVDLLLGLYKSGPAYFYYLDEHTGIPVVSERDSIYPLKIGDPVEMVRKVLPLMLTGMILMRGEKALSVIASILLDKHISLVQQHWVDTAKDLVGFLVSPRTEWTDIYLQDLMDKKDGLIDMIEKGPSMEVPARDSHGISSEWAVELSAVRMLVEMHDHKRTFANLRARRGGHKVMWTRDKRFLDVMSRENFFFYDFKSIADLRETYSEREDSSCNSQDSDEDQLDGRSEDDNRSSPEEEREDGEAPDGYALLFGDLAMQCKQDRDSSDNMEEQKVQDSSPPNDPLRENTFPVATRKSRYATETQPISLLTFDQDCELDDVLQLRIQLDEQESKLEFLKDKLTDIANAEQLLLDEEEEMGRKLDEILGHKEPDAAGPSGLANARKLLLRICDLEDRVLVRGIEVQQLNMDVSCFGIEADDDGCVDIQEEKLPDEVSISKSVPDEISFSDGSL